MLNVSYPVSQCLTSVCLSKWNIISWNSDRRFSYLAPLVPSSAFRYLTRDIPVFLGKNATWTVFHNKPIQRFIVFFKPLFYYNLEKALFITPIEKLTDREEKDEFFSLDYFMFSLVDMRFSSLFLYKLCPLFDSNYNCGSSTNDIIPTSCILNYSWLQRHHLSIFDYRHLHLVVT